MTVYDKENILNQLATCLIDSINNLSPSPKQNTHMAARDIAPQTFSNTEQEKKEWEIIYEHSLAKINKRMVEKYYAPNPLPPVLSESLNERIENSRNQLIKILREQRYVFRNDEPLVI